MLIGSQVRSSLTQNPSIETKMSSLLHDTLLMNLDCSTLRSLLAPFGILSANLLQQVLESMDQISQLAKTTNILPMKRKYQKHTMMFRFHPCPPAFTDVRSVDCQRFLLLRD